VGIGNVSLFTYDNFKKYRYEYLHTSYGDELNLDERYG
jgi:hypothetical protein